MASCRIRGFVVTTPGWDRFRLGYLKFVAAWPGSRGFCGFAVRIPVGISQVCGFVVRILKFCGFAVKILVWIPQVCGFVVRIPVGIPKVLWLRGQDPGWNTSSLWFRSQNPGWDTSTFLASLPTSGLGCLKFVAL